MRRVLLWHGTRLSTRHGELTTQFVKHLDAIIAVYSASGKIKPYELQVFNARYDAGLTEHDIAVLYHRKVKTIRNILYRVMGQIVAGNESQLYDALVNRAAEVQ